MSISNTRQRVLQKQTKIRGWEVQFVRIRLKHSSPLICRQLHLQPVIFSWPIIHRSFLSIYLFFDVLLNSW